MARYAVTAEAVLEHHELEVDSPAIDGPTSRNYVSIIVVTGIRLQQIQFGPRPLEPPTKESVLAHVFTLRGFHL